MDPPLVHHSAAAHHAHAPTILQTVARVDDHALADLQPLINPRQFGVAAADPDRPQPRLITLQREHGPVIAAAKQCGHRNDRGIGTPESDDAHIDAIAVAEPGNLAGRAVEVDHDVHPLLLNAQGRDFGECGRLYAAYTARHQYA